MHLLAAIPRSFAQRRLEIPPTQRQRRLQIPPTQTQKTTNAPPLGAKKCALPSQKGFNISKVFYLP